MSVRVHTHLDDRVAYACDMTGLGPKGVVEAAINDYADALGVPAEFAESNPGFTEQMPHDYSNRRNRRPNGTGEDPDLVMVSVRVIPLTRARLWHSCDYSGQGAQTTVVTALNLYLRKLGVPQNVNRDAKGNLIAG
ncbi:hypothetical protein ACTWPT_56405 [Nonomuraea sp. 3N208]|uniref:hypothetical protein n=1 Tax=Nonomuraea sp. 3N208 TaxID=3457421 RepID=UPI003FCF560E